MVKRGNGGSGKRNGSGLKSGLEGIVSAEDIVNVYDTSAIIHDPDFLTKDTSKTIVIPHIVIEELDQLRIERSTARAYSARAAMKRLRSLLENNKIDSAKGCYQQKGKEIYFMSPEGLLPEFSWDSKPDNHILAVAYQAQGKFPGKQVNLITRDSGLNVKAHSVGLTSHFYDLDFVKVESKTTVKIREYTGLYTVQGESAKKILRDYTQKKKSLQKNPFRIKRDDYFKGQHLYPNEIIFLKELIDVETGTGAPVVRPQKNQPQAPTSTTRTTSVQKQLLLKYDSKADTLTEYTLRKEEISGIQARGLEQQIALDMLLNPEIHLVVLMGEYGSGKTLLALAAGLEQVKMGSDKKVGDSIKRLEREVKSLEKCIQDRTQQLANTSFDWGFICPPRKGRKRDMSPTKEESKGVYKSIDHSHVSSVSLVNFQEIFPVFCENSKIRSSSEITGHAVLGRLGIPSETLSSLWDNLITYCLGKYQEKIHQLGTEKTEKQAALQQLKQKRTGTYEGIPITRAVIPVGKDIGYLPGDESEKISPWLKGIKDNLKEIARSKENPEQFVKDAIDHVIDYLHTGTLRGASMHDRYFILEDSQNYTSHEVKLLVSRAGRGTKIVMTGDLNQIDNPYLNRQTSGLNYLLERLSKLQPTSEYSHRVAVIHLPKSQRSDLTRLAQSLFKDDEASQQQKS